MKTMEREIPEEIKEKVIAAIIKEMPDAELMEDLDVVQSSVSAPIGGKNAAKHDKGIKRKRSVKEERLTKICNKFIGL